MYQGTVQDTGASSAKVAFHSQRGGEEYMLRDSKDHEFVTHRPVIAIQPEFFRNAILSAPALLRPPTFLDPTTPPPPHGGVGYCQNYHVPDLRGGFHTARAQRGHSANYYGDYPGNNPENHPPAEGCTINSKLKNSNI